jgi:hypothetical protein
LGERAKKTGWKPFLRNRDQSDRAAMRTKRRSEFKRSGLTNTWTDSFSVAGMELARRIERFVMRIRQGLVVLGDALHFADGMIHPPDHRMRSKNGDLPVTIIVALGGEIAFSRGFIGKSFEPRNQALP